LVNNGFKTQFNEILIKDFSWNELSNSEVNLKFKIHRKEFNISINNSPNWFDLTFPTKLNKILKELKFEYGIFLIHDIGWDETFAIAFLNKQEYEKCRIENLLAIKE
jgi:hypothetical protein